MERGSLAAGAHELNMSPSAASRLLSGLERTTGLRLFSRDGHCLRPTAEGAQYFNECRRVLIAVDELPRVARRLASGGQSRLKVASGARLANSLMMPAIGRFAKTHPDVEIEFQLVQAHEFSRMISEPPDVAAGAMLSMNIVTVETSPLFEMPTVAIMRRDHVLAKRSFVRIVDVAEHKLIATPPGPRRDDLAHLFRAEGVELHPQYITNSVEHGCSMLLRTGAIMIVDPLVPLAMYPKQFALVPLKPSQMIQTSIFTPVLKPQSRLIAEFKACLREEARDIEKRVKAMLGNSKAAAKGVNRHGSRSKRHQDLMSTLAQKRTSRLRRRHWSEQKRTPGE
jgi:DNA-binding transcriptional LysR family regulator